MSHIDLLRDIEADAQGRELHDRRPAARPTMRDVVVTRTNGNGFQVEDGDWLNWSKFAHPGEVRMPGVGASVRVELDKAGYIRQLQFLGESTWVDPHAVASAPAPVAEPIAPASVAPRLEQDVRGTLITRMNVLSTATAILASGGGAATPDEVIALAGRLEAWVTRG